MSYLGVSSSHLTYHLENLGELVSKTGDWRIMLSSFGKASVSAMKGVQEAPELAKRRPKRLTRRWKAVFAVLMVAVLLLSSFGIYQYVTITQLAAEQSKLRRKISSCSHGASGQQVADMLRNVVQIDTNQYKITLQSNTLEYRDDFNVAEEVLRYSLTGARGNFDVSLRFRENHLSRYQLTSHESYNHPKENPSSNLETAKAALQRYIEYSGDGYLKGMAE